MRYITKLHLKNIQSHVDSIIHLAPPGEITALAGPSDAGKSVVVSRALDWFFNNNWESNYIRHGARNCSVTVYYSDGYVVKIKRPRTGSTSYVITLPNGEKLPEFEGLKNNVPVEVKEITGVHPVEFGNWSFVINLAKQNDGPFMGSSVSGPARARIFGAMAGTDEIDLAVRMLSNQLTRDRQEQKRLAGDPEKKTVGEIGELNTKIAEFDYLDNLRQTIQEVEQLLSQVRQDTELKTKLTQLKCNIDQNSINIIKENLKIMKLSEAITQIEPILQTQDQQINLHDNLYQRFTKLSNINVAISEQESILESTSNVPEIALLLETISSDTKHLEQFTKLHSNLHTAQDGLEKAGRVIALTANTDEIRDIVEATKRDVAIMEKFEDILVKIIANQKAINNVAGILEATANVPVIAEILERTDKDSLTLGKLLPIKDRFVEVNRGLAENEAILQQTANLDEAIKLYADNENKLPLLAALVDLKRRRGEVDLMMGDVARMIEDYGGKVAKEQGKYVGLLKEMGVCELCGSEVQEENLRRVI